MPKKEGFYHEFFGSLYILVKAFFYGIIKDNDAKFESLLNEFEERMAVTEDLYHAKHSKNT